MATKTIRKTPRLEQSAARILHITIRVVPLDDATGTTPLYQQIPAVASIIADELRTAIEKHERIDGMSINQCHELRDAVPAKI